MTIPLPPLRERVDDIAALAGQFLATAATERGAEQPRRLSAAALDELRRRDWPGNVRQLRNEMRRVDALARGEVVEADVLSPPDEIVARQETLHLASLERWAVERAIEQSGGNKAAAARLLGISRRALYNKLAAFGSSGAEPPAG